jgi:hypothetical protein
LGELADLDLELATTDSLRADATDDSAPLERVAADRPPGEW